jgi:hypothetical protein
MELAGGGELQDHKLQRTPGAPMKTRHWLACLAAALLTQADVHGLTPPSDADGPIKLFSCIVTPAGILEAQVESTSDEALTCNIRCTYELGGRMFSHTFSEMIPKGYSGRVGRFDTSSARAGSYSGEVGSCTKMSR